MTTTDQKMRQERVERGGGHRSPRLAAAWRGAWWRRPVAPETAWPYRLCKAYCRPYSGQTWDWHSLNTDTNSPLISQSLHGPHTFLRFCEMLMKRSGWGKWMNNTSSTTERLPDVNVFTGSRLYLGLWPGSWWWPAVGPDLWPLWWMARCSSPCHLLLPGSMTERGGQKYHNFHTCLQHKYTHGTFNTHAGDDFHTTPTHTYTHLQLLNTHWKPTNNCG